MRGKTLSRADIERVFRLCRQTVYTLWNEGKIPGSTSKSSWEIDGTVYKGSWEIDGTALSDWIEETMVTRSNYPAWQSWKNLSPEEWRRQPEWMKVLEVLVLTELSRAALYRMVRKREVPGTVRVGRSWRINRDVLTRWIFGEPG